MPDRSIRSRLLTGADARLNDGRQIWDQDQLCTAVTEWRQLFDRLGADVVAFDLPNGLEWVALDLALLESGRVAVPVPSFFTIAQRAGVIADCGAEVYVTAADASVVEVSALDTHSHRDCAIHVLGGVLPTALPADTALVTYTSGSTGEPKGVCLSAETLLATASALVDTLQPLDVRRHLCVLPLTLLLENVAGLFANLMNGSEIFVPALDEIGIRGSSDVDIVVLSQSFDQYQPHSAIVVPALLLGLTAAAEFGVTGYQSLKFLAVGGGRVAHSLLQRAESQGLLVYEGYGLTECGSVVSMNRPGAMRAGTVGRLLPHVRGRVTNGELVITQPRLLGIVGCTDEFCDFVATGDLAEFDDDGYLTIHGRLKNLFITAFGRNVSPEWVEAELQNELVVGLAAVFGEARESNVAVLVPRGEPSDDDLQQAVDRCNERLPDYARVGHWRRLEMAQLHQMGGLTGNGRIKRDAIAEAVSDFEQIKQLGQIHA